MANEGTFSFNLAITNPPTGGGLYVNKSTSFRFNQSSPAQAGTPGQVAATTVGTVVNLSAITVPGVCYISNLDPANWVQVGLYSTDNGVFYPLQDILPGETWSFRLSDRLGHGEGSGTGTAGEGSTQLMLKGVGGTVNCDVQAFNK